MVSQAAIDDFFAQKTLALVGASRGGKKFGNIILKVLTEKGYRILPVHPQAREIDGVAAYASLAALPRKVGGIVLVVPPAQTEQVVRAADGNFTGPRAWPPPARL